MFDRTIANIPGMKELLDRLKYQILDHLVELPVHPICMRKEVRMFYHNLTISDDGLYVTSQVNGGRYGIG